VAFDEWDDGDSPSAESSLRQLSWRQDATSSFSDWTIYLSTVDNSCKAVYHVHKNVLGTGLRCSQYFARLFLSGNLSENEGNSSSIELEKTAFDIFQEFLDYVYGQASYMVNMDDDDLPLAVEITAESVPKTAEWHHNRAVAMLHLARYFRVKPLFKDATKFIEENLNTITAVNYMIEADQYGEEKVRAAAEEL